MRIVFSVLMALTMTTLDAAQTQTPADVIFINGSIYPGALKPSSQLPGSYPGPSGPTPPLGEPSIEAPKGQGRGGLWSENVPAQASRFAAMAVKDGKIVAIGVDSERILELKGPNTQVIDLGGEFVMPGFNDAHCHLASGGFEKLDVDLVGTKSLEEMKQRIAERAKTAGPGEWLVGRGWDQTLWSDPKLPNRWDLDKVTGDHPAIFNRVDGHIAVANTAALRAVGIDPKTQDSPGGKIDHDEDGDPTGILRERAKDIVFAIIPKPTPAQRRKAAELALQDAAQWGVTSAQDNSEWEDFLTYEQMEKEGRLTLRIAEWLPFDAPVEELQRRRDYHPNSDPLLHTTMLKGFMDGSLGSRTAAMLTPFSDDPGNSGLPRYRQDALDKKTAERAKAGFQIGFHAIGDRAARMALEAFSVGEKESRKRDFRFRIEHAQVVAPRDFSKFKNLRVIASMQPNHLLTDMNWAETHIGAKRAKHSYAWKEFLVDGIPLAFGTDYPVEPITPFRGLYAAITRKNEAGTKEYFPEQRITIAQAIAAYTTGSAYAEFREKEKGLLQPGMLADFVVLDRDILKATPEEILKTRVLRTVVGGKSVYVRNDLAAANR